MDRKSRHFVLRDAVHGDIYLTEEEGRLLDTPQVQRLRGVKQLGTAYLVYPCARHTRFEHSIGSLHMAQRMIDAINRNRELDPAGCLGVDASEARIIRIAALLHDVTHIPFGHNIEDQTGLFARHDSPARFLGMLDGDNEIGAVLDDLGVRREVLAVLCPRGTAGLPNVPESWCQIISDTICSDIFDYLARDAYFTGLNLYYDERLINYFKIDRETQRLYIDCTKRGQLREDILSEIVRMLEARYYFSERVYYHHAKVAAGAVIAKAAERALLDGALTERDFYSMRDETAIDRLANIHCRQPEQRRRIQRLMGHFESRRLLKRACVYPVYENEAIQERFVAQYLDQAEPRIEKEAEIAELVRMATGEDHEIVLYCPARKMQLKEARIHVRWPDQTGIQSLSVYADRIARLGDLERSYRNLWKFYVFASTADTRVLAKVQEICRAVFPEAVNVYNLK